MTLQITTKDDGHCLHVHTEVSETEFAEVVVKDDAPPQSLESIGDFE
jgi:hypothetical protein